MAEFGVGFAAAVGLDAFVVRTVLVPAVMRLCGRANWWLPRWLGRRLPHLAAHSEAARWRTRVRPRNSTKMYELSKEACSCGFSSPAPALPVRCWRIG
ncbi:MMPL family transporter [Nocardia sp. 2YAB30]|uniref:MMPL family transporter n=1 Tax=unclassified Nocardia TaxID=2637762 RepID=UPI003F9D72B1